LVSGGDENRNAKPGFAVLNGHTQFFGEEVNSSICAGPSNREVSEVAVVKDQGQISKMMILRLEGKGLVENTMYGQPTNHSDMTRPSGAQHNTNRGAIPVPSVLQEET